MSTLFQNASEQSAEGRHLLDCIPGVRNGLFLSFSQLPVLRIMSVQFRIKLVIMCCFDFVHYLETNISYQYGMIAIQFAVMPM